MNATEQRQRMRALLNGTECKSPASVFDALSARLAQSVGYELGILAGSVASNTTLAAPDLIVLTLTEFADQIRRIQRAAGLSLIVDADHGYGNALNVMRTVEECEHAGVSCLSIEDTDLPTPYGSGGESFVSIDEGVGKMKAALAARRDPSLVIAGRTAALRKEGIDGAVARLQAYAQAGVDCVFVVGLETLDQLSAIEAAVKLPIIVGSAPASLSRDELAARGARILLQGHQPTAAVVKTLTEVYTHLFNGGAPAELKSSIASAEQMDAVTRVGAYKTWQKNFLGS
ncbi:MAG: isocitrate lyase/PEP mutase family protein [Proteobacteria bacterium]|nr:isocitrate lyase/PEP mutase family protein [Burkholderiales bacterium]